MSILAFKKEGSIKNGKLNGFVLKFNILVTAIPLTRISLRTDFSFILNMLSILLIESFPITNFFFVTTYALNSVAHTAI